MSAAIQRFDQERAAKMIEAAGQQPVRYIQGSADVYRQILAENPEAVDVRVSLAKDEEGKPSALVQAYDGHGKPIGVSLSGHRPCPPCCPNCPPD